MFDPAFHVRDGFACGKEPLDRYLRQQAGQDVRRSMNTLFCATEGTTSDVLGYFTLSACSLRLADVPIELARRLPSYPDLPAYLIGRLAVDQRVQGQALGALLLADALTRCANDRIAAWAVVVEALDEDAHSFYEAFGFIATSVRSRLFLPTATVESREAP